MDSEVRVLHVDDEPDFARMVATFLERADDQLEVATARSADEGFEHLRGNEVDCVVSDYDMPGENGLAFLGGSGPGSVTCRSCSSPERGRRRSPARPSPRA